MNRKTERLLAKTNRKSLALGVLNQKSAKRIGLGGETAESACILEKMTNSSNGVFKKQRQRVLKSIVKCRAH